MIMLDTNICIYILKDRPIGLLEKLNSSGGISVSSIVYAELLFGIELGSKSKRKARSDQLNRFLQRLTVLPWDEKAAVLYSQIRSTLLLVRNCRDSLWGFISLWNSCRREYYLP